MDYSPENKIIKARGNQTLPIDLLEFQGNLKRLTQKTVTSSWRRFLRKVSSRLYLFGMTLENTDCSMDTKTLLWREKGWDPKVDIIEGQMNRTRRRILLLLLRSLDGYVYTIDDLRLMGSPR